MTKAKTNAKPAQCTFRITPEMTLIPHLRKDELYGRAIRSVQATYAAVQQPNPRRSPRGMVQYTERATCYTILGWIFSTKHRTFEYGVVASGPSPALARSAAWARYTRIARDASNALQEQYQ